MKYFFPIFASYLLSVTTFSFAQEQKIQWKSQKKESTTIPVLFHSLSSINLPTSETLKKGNFEYEILHKFLPEISNGYDDYFGIDGPAFIRMSLSYAPADQMLLSLGRSNAHTDSAKAEDNLDFLIKYKIIQKQLGALPLSVAMRFGIAWNTNVKDRDKTDIENFQYIGQLVINTFLMKKLGIGLVPTFVYNSDILNEENQNSSTLGIYTQYYLSDMLSVLLEWNPTIGGFKKGHTPFSAGIELETGGHFFKIFVSNSSLINTAQFVRGADLSFTDSELRLGFSITRILSIGKSK